MKEEAPDFAWKFLWIVSTNFDQNANLQKKLKKNCKKHIQNKNRNVQMYS